MISDAYLFFFKCAPEAEKGFVILVEWMRKDSNTGFCINTFSFEALLFVLLTVQKRSHLRLRCVSIALYCTFQNVPTSSDI